VTLGLMLITPVSSAQTFIGVIPQSASGCPVGSEILYISTDDEDDRNASSVSGWTGAVSRYSTGTNFVFCKVDASGFKSHPDQDYAVLQLSPQCPAGSIGFFRVFDNEHNRNNNRSSGNISPSSIGPPAKLHFCFFPAGTGGTMAKFPNLYVPYGVFAAPSPKWFASGYVYTDDEDDNNKDYTYWTTVHPYRDRITSIIYGVPNALTTKNTYLLTAKVANDKCGEPCPFMGSYDGANCWLGEAPAGTAAFIYANNFYYTPVNGNQCPRPGSWYDGANCFVTAIHPKAKTPFIFANGWYVAPACRP
jgi:hypothetical protein